MRCGYETSATLEPLIRAWRELFHSIDPDLIVCDHSPTVILSAARNIPVVHVGSGFANPPPDKPLMRLHPASARGAEERDARVLQSIQDVAPRLSTPPLQRVPELFRFAEQFSCCLPELDPYRSIRTSAAVGPMAPLPPQQSMGARSFVFGYLSGEDPRVASLLRSLVNAKVPCSMFIRQTPPEWETEFDGTCVRLFDSPQKMPDILMSASAVLHHGGLSTTEIALAAGRPQFLLSRYLEQALTADAVESMGCGINLAHSRRDCGDTISRALARQTFETKVNAMAQRLAARAPINVAQTVVSACIKHLV